MDITYLGHSAFKLKGKNATVVTDPYPASVGPQMPSVSADVVTVSHEHDDHNAVNKVSGTARRETPYVINKPGEYEVQGVGVFGWGSFHDSEQGQARGKNTIYVIIVDGVRVVHLGDLGHVLSDDLTAGIGDVDVVLIPVGGVYTINAEKAVEVVQQLQPNWVIPMHYKTEKHDEKVFGGLDNLEVFLKAMGIEEVTPKDKLSVSMQEAAEETKLVVLKF